MEGIAFGTGSSVYSTVANIVFAGCSFGGRRPPRRPRSTCPRRVAASATGSNGVNVSTIHRVGHPADPDGIRIRGFPAGGGTARRRRPPAAAVINYTGTTGSSSGPDRLHNHLRVRDREPAAGQPPVSTVTLTSGPQREPTAPSPRRTPRLRTGLHICVDGDLLAVTLLDRPLQLPVVRAGRPDSRGNNDHQQLHPRPCVPEPRPHRVHRGERERMLIVENCTLLNRSRRRRPSPGATDPNAYVSSPASARRRRVHLLLLHGGGQHLGRRTTAVTTAYYPNSGQFNGLFDPGSLDVGRRQRQRVVG